MPEDLDMSALSIPLQQIKKPYREIVDAVLLTFSTHVWEIEHAIAPPTHPPELPNWNREELYHSPLGHHLLLLAHFASGSFYTRSDIEHAMQQVYHTMFGNSLTEGYTLPATFRTTALGQLLDEILFRLYQPEELMTPAEAYRSLGIARQSLYDRVAEGTLTAIFYGGEMRLLRAEVDAWRAQRLQRQQHHTKNIPPRQTPPENTVS